MCKECRCRDSGLPSPTACSLARLWGRQTVREAPFVRRALQIGRPNLFFDIKIYLITWFYRTPFIGEEQKNDEGFGELLPHKKKASFALFEVHRM